MQLNNKIILLNFLSYFFLSFPLIIIIGSAAINIYFFVLLILISISCLNFYKEIKLHLFEKFLLIFVFYIVLLNLIDQNTFGFLRILNLIVHTSIFLLLPRLVNLNSIDLKSYFKLLTILIFLIIFDTNIQHILGYNIIGAAKFENRLTSFFIDEAIVGTYLSYFSITVFLYVSFEISRKKFLNQNYLFFLLSLIGLYTILITGERMATLMYFLTLILMSFLLKIKIKQSILILSVSILTIFLVIPKNIYEDRFLRGLSDTIYIKSLSKYSTSEINHRVLISGFQNTYCSSEEFESISYNDRLIIKNIDLNNDKNKKFFIECRKKVNKFINNQNKIFDSTPKGFFSSPIGKIFRSSFILIKNNFLIGVGVKKYRTECNNFLTDVLKSCSTHPHNLYLEIFVEAGFIGLMIFIIFLLTFLINFLKNYSFKNNNLIHILFLSQICMFFILFWPLKTSGSFFASYNGSFIWFNLILLNLILINNKQNNV